jgi:hypothetical protein
MGIEEVDLNNVGRYIHAESNHGQVIPNAPKKIRRSEVVTNPSPFKSAGQSLVKVKIQVPISRVASGS